MSLQPAVGEGPCARGWPRAGRVQTLRGGAQQLRAQAKGLVHGVPGAEHPLVPPHRAYAAPDLVGQGLKARPVVGGEGAGEGV